MPTAERGAQAGQGAAGAAPAPAPTPTPRFPKAARQARPRLTTARRRRRLTRSERPEEALAALTADPEAEVRALAPPPGLRPAAA